MGRRTAKDSGSTVSNEDACVRRIGVTLRLDTEQSEPLLPIHAKLRDPLDLVG
jgi:hypothetical protein